MITYFMGFFFYKLCYELFKTVYKYGAVIRLSQICKMHGFNRINKWKDEYKDGKIMYSIRSMQNEECSTFLKILINTLAKYGANTYAP